MGASLKRNAAWQLLQTIAGTGAELIIVLSFAAAMSSEEFGSLAIALSGTKMVYLLFEPRIHEFLTPKLARYLDRSHRGAWMWVIWSRRAELFLNLAAFAATLALAAIVPRIHPEASSLLFVMCGTYNGCNTLMKFSSLAIFRCIDDVRTAAIFSVSGAILKLVVLAVGLSDGWPATMTLLGLAGVAAVVAVVQAVQARVQLCRRLGAPVARTPGAMRAANRKRQSRLLLSNYGTGLVEIVHRELDVQIAAWFGGVAEAGRYRVAKTLAMVMLEALSPVVMILLPDLSRRIVIQTRSALVAFLRRVSGYLAAIAVAAGVAVITASGIYFTWFATAQRQAWSPLVILVVSFAVLAPGMWAQVFLVAASQPQSYLRSSALGATVACALAALLVPSFGAVGSAVGHAIGLATTTGLAVWAACRLVAVSPAHKAHQ